MPGQIYASQSISAQLLLGTSSSFKGVTSTLFLGVAPKPEYGCDTHEVQDPGKILDEHTTHVKIL